MGPLSGSIRMSSGPSALNEKPRSGSSSSINLPVLGGVNGCIFSIHDGATIDAKTRESIALTVAGANGCDYCASAHTALGGMLGIGAAELSANLESRSHDARLDAILKFASAVVAKRGWVGDEEVAALRAAGLGDREITEIIATVAFNIFTNYFNHIAQTDVDFPLVETTRAAA